jgi:predicted nucleic acid-binding protein
VTSETVVFDASALVRAGVHEAEDALGWVSRAESGEITAHAPDLVFPELASSLLGYVRAGEFPAVVAQERIELVRDLPLVIRPTAELVGAAVTLALERGLSAYDACYAALAEAASATLVTADVRLAAAYSRSVLLA